MKLSIIIPVYNVERYIKHCLSSVMNQDIASSDYEVIVVNDGSTDESMNIVNSYANNYENIRIFSQDNQGLSAARNTGLAVAKGDYVWFVDSDDFIESNCLKEIVGILYDHQLDGLRIRPVSLKDGEFVYDKKKILSGIVTGREGLKDQESYRVTVWLTIYKRSILEKYGLRFKKGIIHEDNEFTPRAYYYLDKLEYLDKHLYYYRENQQSLTNDHKHLQKRANDLIDIASTLYVFCKEKVSKDFKQIFDTNIALVINCAMENAEGLDKNAKDAFVERVVSSKDLMHAFIDSSEMMLKVEGLLLVLFPSSCMKIYSLLKSARRYVLNHKTNTSYIQ